MVVVPFPSKKPTVLTHEEILDQLDYHIKVNESLKQLEMFKGDKRLDEIIKGLKLAKEYYLHCLRVTK